MRFVDIWPELSTRQRLVARNLLAIVPLTLAAYIINWPGAIIAPVLACKLLAAPSLPRGLLPKLCLLAVLAFGGGYLLAFLTAPYPLLNLLTIITLLFLLYKRLAEGLNQTVGLVFLIGLLVVPLFSVTSLNLSYAICIFLIQAVVMAAATVGLIMSALPPVAGDELPATAQASHTAATKRFGDPTIWGLRATLTMLPLLLYCFIGNHPEAKLILIYGVIFSLDPAIYGSVKQATDQIRGCVIAGILATIAYEVLCAVPHLPMLILVVTIFLTILTRQRFAGDTRAGLYANATTTFMVLLGGTFNVNVDDAGDQFYSRVFQIAIAAAYIVCGSLISGAILEWISGRNADTLPAVNPPS